MKKFLVILLTLTLTFSLVACKSEKKPGVSDFNKAVENTAPTSTVLNVKETISGLTLESQFTTTYNEDGSATIVYYYDHVNSSSENGELVVRKNGTVTLDAQGNYTDGDAFTGNVSAATASLKFKFAAKKMTYKLSEDGNILNATVKAANTASVIGTELPADVSLTVTKADGKIVSFTMSYSTADSAVEINCFYTN